MTCTHETPIRTHTQKQLSMNRCQPANTQHKNFLVLGCHLKSAEALQSNPSHSPLCPLKHCFVLYMSPFILFPLSSLLVSKHRLCKGQKKKKLVQKVMQRPRARASWRLTCCMRYAWCPSFLIFSLQTKEYVKTAVIV